MWAIGFGKIARIGAVLLIAFATPFQYLIRDTNDIITIDHSPKGSTEDGAKAIARIACEGFTQLLSDPQLKPAIEAYVKRIGTKPVGAEALLANVQRFRNEFMLVEAKRLQDLGLSPAASRDTLAELSRAGVTQRRSGRNALQVVAAKDIMTDLAYLKDAACRLENNPSAAAKKDKLLVGLLGTVVVIADIAVVEAGPIGPAVAELSVHLGYGMMVEGLTAFR